MSRLLKVVKVLNVPGHICQHTLGKEHTAAHRMLVGSAVMLIGVLTAKAAHHFESYMAQVMLDLVGYGVHGFGLTPFLEKLLEMFAED
jgi:hypothetical protein